MEPLLPMTAFGKSQCRQRALTRLSIFFAAVVRCRAVDASDKASGHGRTGSVRGAHITSRGKLRRLVPKGLVA